MDTRLREDRQCSVKKCQEAYQHHDIVPPFPRPSTLLQAGEVAGIKSCEMKVEGDFAYGYLAGEKGTHRLVRQSPFNAQAKRQTSFAGVESFPIIEQEDLS